MEFKTEARRIGGSIGIIIPNEIVRRENIRIREKITVELKRGHTVGEFFGLTQRPKPTEELMKEIRE